MAIMIRAGSRALRMTATAPGLVRLKYGSTNSSRRRRLFDRDIALRGPFAHPALKLIGDLAQGGPCHRIDLSIRIDEADYPLRLLERLNQPIEQNAVEATIMPADTIFVVLEEGVHALLPAAVLQPGS